MPKPTGRASLMGLKAGLPALPRVDPVTTTAEMMEKILGVSEELPAGDKDVFTERRPSGGGNAQTLAFGGQITGRRKEPTVLMNAKLPLSLHSRLKRTAQFNDISMTEILILAIETELATGRYATPPETWGSQNGR